MSRDGAAVVDMSRGSVPVVGVVLVTFLAVVLAVAVGAVMTTTTPERPPTAQLGLSADASAQEIALAHEGGETLTVSNLELQIEVDGRDLAQQPTVPFFASEGFRGGPEGPFNDASDDEWHAGETATLRLASTNAPAIEPDSTVTVVVVTDGAVIFEETVRAV
jgi:FlaG/FlaF family flagellin (archaellin)